MKDEQFSMTLISRPNENADPTSKDVISHFTAKRVSDLRCDCHPSYTPAFLLNPGNQVRIDVCCAEMGKKIRKALRDGTPK